MHRPYRSRNRRPRRSSENAKLSDAMMAARVNAMAIADALMERLSRESEAKGLVAKYRRLPNGRVELYRLGGDFGGVHVEWACRVAFTFRNVRDHGQWSPRLVLRHRYFDPEDLLATDDPRRGDRTVVTVAYNRKDKFPSVVDKFTSWVFSCVTRSAFAILNLKYDSASNHRMVYEREHMAGLLAGHTWLDDRTVSWSHANIELQLTERPVDDMIAHALFIQGLTSEQATHILNYIRFEIRPQTRATRVENG